MLILLNDNNRGIGQTVYKQHIKKRDDTTKHYMLILLNDNNRGIGQRVYKQHIKKRDNTTKHYVDFIK